MSRTVAPSIFSIPPDPKRTPVVRAWFVATRSFLAVQPTGQLPRLGT
ncbi:hypothetical protein [Streptomyces sp. NPDC058739]